jgi:hypothetical protein
VPADGTTPEGCVEVEGIMSRFGLHPQRLEDHRTEVGAWLMALPHTFRKSSGGGWSFLNACHDEDGNQWGEHRNMEQLFVLGIALGLARWLLPRDMWPAFPGGMPYVGIDDDARLPAAAHDHPAPTGAVIR